MNMKHTISRGFSIVEVAIVLVIFSLVVTGILRGQELINSAKARNLIDQKSSFQTAFIAFSNRYKLMAGDLTSQQASFIGNGVIASNSVASTAGDGRINFNDESILVFQNLTATSFLSCANCMRVTANGAATTANTYINSYSQSLQFGTVSPSTTVSGTTTLYWLDPNPTLMPAKNVLATGSKVPAAILQQVDQKADDGFPQSGLFRQSSTDGADSTTATASTTGCTTTSTVWANNGNGNCAGAWLF